MTLRCADCGSDYLYEDKGEHDPGVYYLLCEKQYRTVGPPEDPDVEEELIDIHKTYDMHHAFDLHGQFKVNYPLSDCRVYQVKETVDGRREEVRLR